MTQYFLESSALIKRYILVAAAAEGLITEDPHTHP